MPALYYTKQMEERHGVDTFKDALSLISLVDCPRILTRTSFF